MHIYLESRLPQLIEICKSHKVSKLYAFGSVLTDKFSSQSDIDLLIEIDQTLDPVERGEMWWQLFEKLPELLKKNVDLITLQSLKNKYFIQNLDRTKVAIYE